MNKLKIYFALAVVLFTVAMSTSVNLYLYHSTTVNTEARTSALYVSCLLTRKNVDRANAKWAIVESQMLSSAEGLAETNPALSRTYRHNADLVASLASKPPVCSVLKQ